MIRSRQYVLMRCASRSVRGSRFVRMSSSSSAVCKVSSEAVMVIFVVVCDDETSCEIRSLCG